MDKVIVHCMHREVVVAVLQAEVAVGTGSRVGRVGPTYGWVWTCPL